MGCSVTERSFETKWEEIHSRGRASIGVLDRGIVNNETPSKETGGESDEDADLNVWSHEDRLYQKRTRERISKVAPVTNMENRNLGGNTHVKYIWKVWI